MCPGSQSSELRELISRIEQATAASRPEAISKLVETAREAPFDAVLECLRLLQHGKITVDEIAPHVGAFLEIWRSVYELVAQAQQEGQLTEWLLEHEYTEARALASVALDLFGYLSGSTISQELHHAIKLLDPRFKAFAALSLIRRGESVDPPEIERVAASDEVRILFWDELKKLGMTRLMPERWSTPKQLAASDLVQWAAHPMEMGTPPEEIEHMATYLIDFEGAEVAVFLFRFREFPKPWAPSEGWMAGIAGPYTDGERVGNPWSAFAPWDSKSPEEHFKKLIASVSWCDIVGDDEAPQ